jgi:hypothetical protein
MRMHYCVIRSMIKSYVYQSRFLLGLKTFMCSKMNQPFLLFAERLDHHLEEGEVDNALGLLDVFRAKLDLNSHIAKDIFPLHMLGIWFVETLGPLDLSKDQLVRIKGFFEHICRIIAKHNQDGSGLGELKHAGLENMEIPSLLETIAIFTANQQGNGEIFYSVLKRTGLLVPSILRKRSRANNSLPIHIAAETGNAYIVFEILKADRDQLHMVNAIEQTAGQIAEAAGHTVLANELTKRETVGRERNGLALAGRGALKRKLPEPEPMMAEVVQKEQKQQGASSIDDMLSMLKGFIPAEEPSVSERQVQVHAQLEELKTFIRVVCNSVPGGKLLGPSYSEFFLRLGITNVEQLKAEVQKGTLRDRVPSWMLVLITETSTS